MISSATNSVAGIDQASISFAAWNNGMTLAIWTDVTGGRTDFPPPITTKAEGYVIEGNHKAIQYGGERTIKCRCASRDGQTGAVTINGQVLDLAQGNLFLVSTISGQTHVRQLKRDLNIDKMMDLAKKDQEIRSFFMSCSKPK